MTLTEQRIPTAIEASAVLAGIVDSDLPAHARAREADSFYVTPQGPGAAAHAAASAGTVFRQTEKSESVGGHFSEGRRAQAGGSVRTEQTQVCSGEPGQLRAAEGVSGNITDEVLDGDSQSSSLQLALDPFKSSDEWRITQANRRLELVQTYRALLEQGHSGVSAAKAMGEDHVSLWRYNKAFEKAGYNGLVPATDKCGRKSEIQKLRELLGPELLDKILAEIQGLNLDTESTTAALRSYASSDRCPAELADLILDPSRCSKHALPPSLRKAVTPNANSRLAHRGARKLSLQGIYTPRRTDILPGDIFSADDTTPIWAWWVPWVTNEEYPFGVKLLQGQFIPVIDVASQCIVSFTLIAREKSSYRASDIWNLFGHTFETVGLPRLGWQLERGSWEANIIRGQEIDYRDDEVTMSRRVGGLRQLPTNLCEWHKQKLTPDQLTCFPKTLNTWTSYLPKSKSIEGWFNRHQTFEGTLWGSLGRDQMRNPFEKTKKKFQECQRGADDPRNHFLSGTEMAARIKALIDYVNGEPMEGEVFAGIPRLKFDQATREFPLYFMPEEQRYLYRRDWRTLQITKGYARVRLSDPFATTAQGRRYSLFYCNPAVFAGKEGEEVVVYYDRENFEQPAQVHLARNGEFLCEAPYVERVGSFLEGDLSGHDIRKQWRNAVLSIYGTIVDHAPSRQVPSEIAARRREDKETRGQGDTGTVTLSPGPQVTLSSVKPAIVPSRKSTGLFPAPPTPDAWSKQQERLKRQAEQANRLRALTNNG
jgi:hypothetical protein